MPTEEHEESHRGFEIRSSIPVLRMFDEARAKAFYLDYLGFEVDWESRFTPTAPLYMQIHLGDAIIHLNGHAEEDAPIYRSLCKLVDQRDTYGVSYASDAGPLQQMGLDCVLFGPGNIEVAHKPNERLPKEEFVRARELLDQVVQEFCCA